MNNHLVYYFQQVNVKPLKGSSLLEEHNDATGAYLSCVSGGSELLSNLVFDQSGV